MHIPFRYRFIAALLMVLGAMTFSGTSHASNCMLTTPPVINANIDVLAASAAVISVPAIPWTCDFDQKMTAANSNFCYRLDPAGGQVRDNNSFYVLGPSDSRLGFIMRGADNGDISKNDNSLGTEGFDWGPNTGDPGTKLPRNTDAWRILIYPFMQQDLVRAGTYSGTYNFWIYQQDNDTVNGVNNCANMPYTSRSLAGTFKLTITVQKNCLLESPTNIDFGSVGSVAAMNQPTATGSVAIRCTYQTPYSISFDNGQNNPSGPRSMKSADGLSLIPYQLCSDKNCTNPWTTGPILSGNGGPVNTATTVPVYARIPKLATAPVASTYSDTVVATVTF
jgi:spore coat protein U-like protein